MCVVFPPFYGLSGQTIKWRKYDTHMERIFQMYFTYMPGDFNARVGGSVGNDFNARVCVLDMLGYFNAREWEC